VDASLQWYDDVFAVHGIPTLLAGGLWCAKGEPPRWHSAAKTLDPTVPTDRVLLAVEQFEHCSVADSFGTLDPSAAGFELLFEATWVHRTPLVKPTGQMPGGWSVVTEPDELRSWNALHDTTGVLVPSLLAHPRFTFLARHEDGVLTGGAVLHDCRGEIVGLSNTWALPARRWTWRRSSLRGRGPPGSRDRRLCWGRPRLAFRRGWLSPLGPRSSGSAERSDSPRHR
jgi:hypothetical protein